MRPLFTSIAAVIMLLAAGCAAGSQLPPGNTTSISTLDDISRPMIATPSPITFAPKSPAIIGENASLDVAISETGYSSGFTVAGCKAVLGSGYTGDCKRATDGKTCQVNLYAQGSNDITAQIAPGGSTLYLNDVAGGAGIPVAVCKFKIEDTLGHFAWFRAQSG